MDSAGNLFGATKLGGATDNGTIYEVAKGSNVIIDLASFNGTDGDTPRGVALDSRGDIFGNTQDGSVDGDRVVFELAKGSGAITELAQLTSTTGDSPVANVVLDTSGNLFGVTAAGGANNGGTVYEIAGAAGAPEPSELAVLRRTIFGLAGLLLRARR